MFPRLSELAPLLHKQLNASSRELAVSDNCARRSAWSTCSINHYGERLPLAVGLEPTTLPLRARCFTSFKQTTRQDSLFKPEGQSPYGQKYIIIYMQSGEQLHNIIMYRVITCFNTTWYK